MPLRSPDEGFASAFAAGPSKITAELFWLAQARRLLRFCGEAGLDADAVIAGVLTADLTDIRDGEGRVIPSEADLTAVLQGR